MRLKSEKRYIPSRFLVSIWLFVFGCHSQTSFVMARGIALAQRLPKEDADAIKEQLPKTKKLSFWHRVLWALICLSAEKPNMFLLLFAGFLVVLISYIRHFVR